MVIVLLLVRTFSPMLAPVPESRRSCRTQVAMVRVCLIVQIARVTLRAAILLGLEPSLHLFPLEFITINMSPSIRGGTLIDDSG